MAKRKTQCTAPKCTAPAAKHNNLCARHRLPGIVGKIDDITVVFTRWYAERGNECGIIVMGDWLIALEFDGADGFKKHLCDQGFVNVRLLSSEFEVKEAQVPRPGMKYGTWAGSSLMRYARENAADQDYNRSDPL